MTRLIINIVFFVILAVFVAINVGNSGDFQTDVNLFGFKMIEVPTIAVILVSMAVGVLYSFTFYLTSYFTRVGKSRRDRKRQKNTMREKELNEREKLLVTDAPPVTDAVEQPDETEVPEEVAVEAEKAPKKRFGKKKKN